jgi:hypothetical protein
MDDLAASSELQPCSLAERRSDIKGDQGAKRRPALVTARRAAQERPGRELRNEFLN